MTGAFSTLFLALVVVPTNLTPEQRAQLDAGQILIERINPKDGQGLAVEAMGVISAEPVRVLGAVDDCANFAKFMPRTAKSEERARKGNHSICFVEIQMPFPFKNLWSITDVYRTQGKDGTYSRSWKLREGTYRKNRGSWTLLPWGDKRESTLAVYRIETDPKIAVPDFIARRAQAGSLPKVFTAVRNRVAR